jgi:urease accessory protein
VIARTAAVVERGGVLGELACAPPLTLRRVHGEDAGRCELCLVGTAAGPLAGDDLALRLELRAGARATLRATGASIAQGRPGGGPSGLSVRADLAEGADLIADPGALIVCHGSRVNVRVELALAAGAAVDWRELIVLGRSGEPPGQATLRWDVTRAGRPVLRQFTDLADPALAGWTAMMAGRRVLACAFVAGPGLAPRTVVASPVAVAQRLADEAVLVTVLADDAASASRELDQLCTQARSPRPEDETSGYQYGGC